MPQRSPDKSCRLPSGRIVRLGRRALPQAPWAAECTGSYFLVLRRPMGWSGTEAYRQPFELQTLVLDSLADAQALAEALNGRAVRLAASEANRGTAEAA